MQIFDIDNWREIGATLARNKTRTLLTAFGIFWGTAMLTLLWGGSHGLRTLMGANFDGVASNSLMMFPSRTTVPYKGFRKGMRWSLDRTDMHNIQASVPGIEAASPMSQRSTTYKYSSRTKSGAVQGVEPGFAIAMPPIITSGRFINESDVAAERKVAVIGERVASELFRGEDPIGRFIEVDNIHYRVVGVMRARSRNINFSGTAPEDAVYVPLTTMCRAYNYGQKFDFMMLIFKPGYKPADAKDAIIRSLRQNHPIAPSDDAAVHFWDMSEMFEMVGKVFTGIDILLLFVGFSSLLAGIIGVGNIMWIVVKERTKEFGIRRAIGATPRSILWQILSESAVLTIIAGLAGVCFAVGILALASTISPGDASPNFLITFGESMVILALFIVLGAAAGTIPALKAMKIKPVEAMNDK